MIHTMRKTLMAFSLLVLLGATTSAFAAKQISGPAPDFTLKTLSGKNIKLSEMRGTVILLNFWASWCAPCRLEMPLLSELHTKYKDLGFAVLGVNVEEDVNMPRRYIADRPVDFPVLLDNTNKVSKLYKVIAMPTTVLIDRDGNMRYLHQGYKPGDEKKYQKMLKKLIRE
jgi:peroxiredoxin